MKECENTEDWSSVSETQSAEMLERGVGRRDDEEAVCGMREWKALGDVGRGEEGMEEEADEEGANVGISVGG